MGAEELVVDGWWRRLAAEGLGLRCSLDCAGVEILQNLALKVGKARDAVGRDEGADVRADGRLDRPHVLQAGHRCGGHAERLEAPRVQAGARLGETACVVGGERKSSAVEPSVRARVGGQGGWAAWAGRGV